MIIFDLDDTLINTSETLTPLVLSQVLQKLIAKGLVVPNVNQTLKALLKLDRQTCSSKETIQKFLKGFNKKFEPSVLEKISQFSSLPPGANLQAHKGALKLLNSLQVSHTLSLVSIGEKTLQLEKMKKAGIDCSIFSKIIISRQKDKGRYYAQLAASELKDAKEVIVCGDRVLLDLVPGKKLGFTTIHVKKGRGQNHNCAKPFSAFVDYEVEELWEIFSIVEQMQRLH